LKTKKKILIVIYHWKNPHWMLDFLKSKAKMLLKTQKKIIKDIALNFQILLNLYC